MATFTAIRDGIKTRLETITGVTVYDTVPDYLDPPAAIVAPLTSLDYDATMGRGADTYQIPVIFYIQRVDAATAQDSLDTFLQASGSDSVKAAIEGDITLGGAAMSVRVVSASDYGEYEVSQGTSYLGVTFNLEVIA